MAHLLECSAKWQRNWPLKKGGGKKQGGGSESASATCGDEKETVEFAGKVLKVNTLGVQKRKVGD